MFMACQTRDIVGGYLPAFFASAILCMIFAAIFVITRRLSARPIGASTPVRGIRDLKFSILMDGEDNERSALPLMLKI